MSSITKRYYSNFSRKTSMAIACIYLYRLVMVNGLWSYLVQFIKNALWICKNSTIAGKIFIWKSFYIHTYKGLGNYWNSPRFPTWMEIEIFTHSKSANKASFCQLRYVIVLHKVDSTTFSIKAYLYLTCFFWIWQSGGIIWL